MKFSDGSPSDPVAAQALDQKKCCCVEIVLILLKHLQSDEENKAWKIINELYLPFRSVAESG